MKTMKDTKCDKKDALAWACSAKNSLQNNFGYCPNQMVFGKNVNVPSVLTDELPALDHKANDEILRNKLSVIQSARENYMKAENSDKIRRALHAQTRTFSSVPFDAGDKVYYKQMGFKDWHGVATVIGFDGNTVLVKHGGSVYKCHRCHVMKKKNFHLEKKASKSENSIAIKNISNRSDEKRDDFESSSDEDTWLPSSVTIDLGSNDNQEVPIPDSVEVVDEILNSDVLNFIVSGEVGNEVLDSESIIVDEQVTFYTGDIKPLPKSYVSLREFDHDWCDAEILATQPKLSATSSNRDWVNVYVTGKSDPFSINWNHVERWRYIPVPEKVIALSKSDELKQEVVDAKAAE